MPFLSERFVVLMIFGAHLLGFLQLCKCQSRCGPEKPKCPQNLCCSTSGYCGDTVEHCQTFCNPIYGRCDPFKVNASIGFPSIGNRCGLENNNRYCPNGWCCSEFGFCDRTAEHCFDGCQLNFGHCDVIANCSLPSHEYSIFPTMPAKQRTLSSTKGKNFWYLFCKPGTILKEISQPQPVTCNQNDGTWPTLPVCDENVVYKPIETDPIFNEISDGNLLTCRHFPKGVVKRILIHDTRFAIRDIRITTHKTSLNVFTLSIVDIDRLRKNETTHWEKTFNDTIEYGKTVVFLSNVTTPLMSHWKRSIQLHPLSDMRICEIEVSSFYSGQGESEIKWIAIVTSSIIFFLLVVLILTVLCFRSQSKMSKNRDISYKDRHSSSSKNHYSLPEHERTPHPPSSDAIFPGRSSFGFDDNVYYEEIIYDLNAPVPQLHNNLAGGLQAQPEYDEVISLGTVLKIPRFAPPATPRVFY